MRKLYNEFFYIPKHGKVREKVMLTRVAMTIVVMVMCLAAMSITAYAYFSYNVTSGSNIIKAANFDANVSITIKDSSNDPVTVTKDGKVQTANLDAGKYTIELTKGNSTADTGFCVISIGDKTYYTDQIGVDVKKDLTDATVKFDLWLSSPTKLEVLSHWGTSVYYGYGDDGRTEIFIVSGNVLDLTTQTTSEDGGKSEDNTDKSEENTTTTPSTNTTTGTESSSTQTPESTTTTPSTETSTPVETTPPETTGTSEPTSTTEPATQTTEPASTESSTETQPTTENAETTGAPTTEANE
ncbi:MAG: hypothetical protein IKJ74_00570 [Clostridia bacterium]|nr:hypothetical protein [Clostridia bacterium]